MVKKNLIIICLVLVLSSYILAGEKGKIQNPLILQKMCWPDVQEYLETCDMVIIPIGSTEQHGPHLPLGTDYYEALAISKLVSARTGVMVAPVVMAGYSVYHSGFPGTLSLKPGTLERVLFETCEMLMKYGFRKFMFLNYHGGNSFIENNVIHRINHTTEAVAVRIGIRAPFQKRGKEAAPLDYHAGTGETSIMLYLKPELVKMGRIEKPKITLSPKASELAKRIEEHPELSDVMNGFLGVPVETKKGGASHEISSNGIWTLGDPKTATKERGEKSVRQMVENAVKFIEAWRKTK
jgi:creatinine amidohydrolase